MGVDAEVMSSAHARLVGEVAQLVLWVAGRLQESYALQAAEFDLTLGQGKVLIALQPGESIAMRELADRIRFNRSNLTGVVDRLEERGLLHRKPDPTDRRVKELELTPAGTELRSTFWTQLAVTAGPLGRLSEPDLRTLHGLIGSMTTAPVAW